MTLKFTGLKAQGRLFSSGTCKLGWAQQTTLSALLFVAGAAGGRGWNPDPCVLAEA